MREYTGPLDYAKMPKDVKRAYASWCAQRHRCYNPKHPHYRYYGGKGLAVKYSSREFINWWLRGVKRLGLRGVVVCERIDHSKGYSFDNIKLGTPTSNTLECASRGVWNKAVLLISSDGRSIKRFPSVKEAAKFAGSFSSCVSKVCRGVNKSTKGFVFKYET